MWASVCTRPSVCQPSSCRKALGVAVTGHMPDGGALEALPLCGVAAPAAAGPASARLTEAPSKATTTAIRRRAGVFFSIGKGESLSVEVGAAVTRQGTRTARRAFDTRVARLQLSARTARERGVA